jgi:hypothetical protein
LNSLSLRRGRLISQLRQRFIQASPAAKALPTHQKDKEFSGLFIFLQQGFILKTAFQYLSKFCKDYVSKSVPQLGTINPQTMALPFTKLTRIESVARLGVMAEVNRWNIKYNDVLMA